MLRDWTNDDDDALRRAASQGISAGEIAVKLGRSRSAVLGRAHRIGLSFKQFGSLSDKLRRHYARRRATT